MPDICLTVEGKSRYNLNQETEPTGESNPDFLRKRQQHYLYIEAVIPFMPIGFPVVLSEERIILNA